MTHRERVLTALAHRPTDRVPRHLGLVGDACTQFRQRTGSDNPTAFWDLDLSGGVGFKAPAVNWASRFGHYYQDASEPLVFEFNE